MVYNLIMSLVEEAIAVKSLYDLQVAIDFSLIVNYFQNKQNINTLSSLLQEKKYD